MTIMWNDAQNSSVCFQIVWNFVNYLLILFFVENKKRTCNFSLKVALLIMYVCFFPISFQSFCGSVPRLSFHGLPIQSVRKPFLNISLFFLLQGLKINGQLSSWWTDPNQISSGGDIVLSHRSLWQCWRVTPLNMIQH